MKATLAIIMLTLFVVGVGAAFAQKAAPAPVIVRASSYETSHGHSAPIYWPGFLITLPTTSNRTEITVSNHPGQTFLIESSVHHLEPGKSYDGQWGKHENSIKVRCFIHGYHWGKMEWTYVSFKVVGRGVFAGADSQAVAAPTTNSAAKFELKADAATQNSKEYKKALRKFKNCLNGYNANEAKCEAKYGPQLGVVESAPSAKLDADRKGSVDPATSNTVAGKDWWVVSAPAKR
jgi:hypothetical protein